MGSVTDRDTTQADPEARPSFGGGAAQGEKARPEDMRGSRRVAEPADLGVNEAHLVRKLDLCLIPLVMGLYLFSFLDR